jgi:putative transposase
MQALNQLAPEVGLAPACAALNLNRSSVYREDARRRLLLPATATLATRPPAPLAFSANERQQLRDVLNSERFADCSPYFVYATLLDEGRYIGSVRTLYRALEADGQSAERRHQRTHPVYPSRNSWPPRPTRSGAGISRNSKAQPNGPVSTCM